MRLRIACLLAVLVSWIATGAIAQIPAGEAKNLGMEIAWQAQIQLPAMGRGVVSSHLYADPNQPRTYAVVDLPDRTIRISAAELDKYGEPVGIEGAKKLATQQAARILGKSDGFEVVEVTVPRLRLVLVTKDGLVQCLDAETGQLLWATVCGPSNAPAHPAAVSPAGMVLIHGGELYLIGWEKGQQLMTKPLRYASSNAVAVSNDIAFVSDFTGRVEAYGLSQDRRPWGYVMQGRAIGKSVSLADQSFCAIASSVGFVYVFTGGEQPSVYIRFDSSSPINGSLTAGNGAFYAGTAGGLLTKITIADRLGELEWEVRTGQTITAPALVVGNQVVAANESGDLFSVDDQQGTVQWATNGLGIAVPVALGGGKLFCTTLAGEIYAFDAADGRLTGKTSPLDLAAPIINQLNDRLYVLGERGKLTCLRPVGGDLPKMVTPVQPAPASEEASESAPAAETAPAASSANPFATGGGTTPAAGNPFGSGNPFGAPATPESGDEGGGMANPFGDNPFGAPAGGSNPFGTP